MFWRTLGTRLLLWRRWSSRWLPVGGSLAAHRASGAAAMHCCFNRARAGHQPWRENGSPYAYLLIGGVKVTRERTDPALKRATLDANKNLDPMLDYTLHGQYTTADESSALAVTAGMGVDYKLNSALAIRVAIFEYLRSGARTLGGVAYNNGFQMTTGMVLRLGIW